MEFKKIRKNKQMSTLLMGSPPLTWEHEGRIKETCCVAFAKSEFPMYWQLPNAKWGAE